MTPIMESIVARTRAEGAIIVPDLDNGEYHRGPGLSSTGVRRFRRSPFHFRALAADREDRPDLDDDQTAAMFNGTLVHCATLEPAQFHLRYAIGPDVRKNSAEWREFVASAGTRTPITSLQAVRAMAQAEALRSLPDVAPLLSKGEPEQSAFWIDPDTGVLCKCRPDWVTPVAHGTGSMLLDVKTTTDASEDAFARTVVNYGYHQQADWYVKGWGHASRRHVYGFVFAVVESTFPFAAASYILDDDALQQARRMNHKALRQFAECERRQEWPGYPKGMQVLSLPAWALRNE